MVLGIPCQVSESPHYIQITTRSLKILTAENILADEIYFESITSLHVKNEDRFFLRLAFGPGSEAVLKFDSYLSRDILKSLVIFAEREIKERPKIDTGSADVLDELLTRYRFSTRTLDALSREVRARQLRNFRLSDVKGKNDLLECFMKMPYLLYIYVEMQVTTKQFFNLLRGSYFFDGHSDKNVIDRRIQEMLGMELNFASRINRQNSDEVRDVGQISAKPLVEKEIAFQPVYPFEESAVEEAGVFREPALEELEVDIRAVNEPACEESEYFKGNVVKICAFIYENRNSTEKIGEIRKLAEAVEEEMLRNVGESERKYFERVLPTFFFKKE